MVYEMRVYQVKPGKLPAYLKLFEEVGMPVRRRYGELIGFWFTDIGELNQVVHVWAYESLDRRTALRAQLMQDAQWVEGFLPLAMPMLDSMKSTVMHAANFSPLR
jgi:hypothetical protein